MDFDRIRPMLLGEVRAPFSGPEWGFEIKYDGWRMLADIDHGAVRLRTKNGAEAGRWFPEIVESLSGLPGHQRLDGEICVLDDVGRSDFNRLQDRAKLRRYKAGADLVAFLAFDILVADGRDVMASPWRRRKARLSKLLATPPDQVVAIGHVEANGEWLFEQVLALGLEGMVAKRMTSPYVPGLRTTDWLKVKRKGAISAQRFRREE